MSYPSTLAKVGGAWITVNHEYRKVTSEFYTGQPQSSSTETFYVLWVDEANAGSWHTNGYHHDTEIKVTHGTDIWSDAGSSAPTVDANTSTSSTIQLRNVSGGNLLYEFNKPSVSSGGGTSTEGWSYSGSLTVVGTTLQYSIPATSSAGTYTLMSSASATPQITITHGSSISSGSAPNFDQTKIWTLLSPYGDELDEINLTAKKKVFCNFW